MYSFTITFSVTFSCYFLPYVHWSRGLPPALSSRHAPDREAAPVAARRNREEGGSRDQWVTRLPPCVLFYFRWQKLLSLSSERYGQCVVNAVE